MKTFKDLEFKTHSVAGFATHAIMSFDNEYGVSVINGKHAYCGDDTFEVAILYDDTICYSSGITDDVIADQTPEQVTEIMKQVQNLK